MTEDSARNVASDQEGAHNEEERGIDDEDYGAAHLAWARVATLTPAQGDHYDWRGPDAQLASAETH